MRRLQVLACLLSLALLVAVVALSSFAEELEPRDSVSDPVGTALAHQDRPAEGGSPANGEYDSELQGDATVSGGSLSTASGRDATASKDSFNTASGNSDTASGAAATVGGGRYNAGSRVYAAVASGASNIGLGDNSFVAVRLAQAEPDGTFAGADPSFESSVSTGNEQYPSRAFGGVGSGTESPSATLHILHNHASGEPSLILENEHPTGRATISFRPDSTEQASIYVNVDGATIHNTNGGGTFFRSNGSNRMIIHDSGTVELGVLKITGGSDIAEPFGVREEDAVKPGMVMIIDPEHPGMLAVSEDPYDRRVAGIISGAGDIEPGMVMAQSGSVADGQYPLALTGRVYCWADASNGPIQPGDLLTTSSVPGHAMKVADHARAQGAIIGKAMSGLADGRGLVLVLVSLQ